MTSAVYLKLPLGWAVRTVEGVHQHKETFSPFNGIPDAVREHITAHTSAVIVTPGTDHIKPRPMQAATILNACGRAMLSPHVGKHTAWQKTDRQFGTMWEAFTLEGNICARYEQVAFKGATNRQRLARVLNELFNSDEDPRPHLQIVVLTARLGTAIFIHRDCLLECALQCVPWANVMSRLEELCNVVLFQVSDWSAMQLQLGMEAWEHVPASTTVSVSRRGVVTVRLTWREVGRPWEDNTDLVDVTDRLTRFIRTLV